jgi:hypothetical protein
MSAFYVNQNNNMPILWRFPADLTPSFFNVEVNYSRRTEGMEEDTSDRGYCLRKIPAGRRTA